MDQGAQFNLSVIGAPCHQIYTRNWLTSEIVLQGIWGAATSTGVHRICTSGFGICSAEQVMEPVRTETLPGIFQDLI